MTTERIECAERLENEAIYDGVPSELMNKAADLLREADARIAELEKRQIKVRWTEEDEGAVCRVGKIVVGTVSSVASGHIFADVVTEGGIIVWDTETDSGAYATKGPFPTESEARAAVEVAAHKMVGGE